jgi:hypothetical protein
MILELVIAILAVYRVAVMVSSEKGPFAIFEGLRDLVGKTFPPKNGKQSWVDQGINCPLCISFWLGFAAAPIVRPSSVYEFVLYALAISGGAVAVYLALQKW